MACCHFEELRKTVVPLHNDSDARESTQESSDPTAVAEPQSISIFDVVIFLVFLYLFSLKKESLPGLFWIRQNQLKKQWGLKENKFKKKRKSDDSEIERFWGSATMTAVKYS